MRKIISVICWVIALNLSAQIPYFKDVRLPGGYNNKMYRLQYLEEKNFFGTTLYVKLDTVYLNIILKTNILDSEKIYTGSHRYYEDSNRPYYEDAINYINSILEDNRELKGKLAKKEIHKAYSYKNRLWSEIAKYDLLVEEKKKKEQIVEDSINEVQRIKAKKLEMENTRQDSLMRVNTSNELKVLEESSSETYGIGNNTFRMSPQMLSNLLLRNPSLKNVEATFPRWSSIQDKSDLYLGRKGYEMAFNYSVLIEYYPATKKVKNICIAQCTSMQIKSFVQKLIDTGFRLNAGASDLAHSVSYGGTYEYYSKKGSPITFVIHLNRIDAFCR